jgi:hypothetical protein
MLFYHKGLRVRKKPLPFVSCDRKAAILRVQFWATHSSVAVGIITTSGGKTILAFRRIVQKIRPYGQVEAMDEVEEVFARIVKGINGRWLGFVRFGHG